MPASLLKNTVFAIVLYNKPIHYVLRSLPSAILASSTLMIYDNSQEEQVAPDGIRYVHDPGNSGVSKAYNTAARLASTLSKPYLFLLDHDTLITDDDLNQYELALNMYPGVQVCIPRVRDQKGLLSPFRFKRGRGYRLRHVSAGVQSMKDLFFINSGLLIGSNTFRMVNGYDERFPLDFSDIVFCQKLQSAVDNVVVVDTMLNHNLSSSDPSVGLDAAVNRFQQYLSALSRYREMNNQNFSARLAAFPWCLKLTLRYTSYRFFNVLIKGA